MTRLTERQLETLRELNFHGGTRTILVLADKAPYDQLADKGYVVTTHLAHGALHVALTGEGRAALNSFMD